MSTATRPPGLTRETKRTPRMVVKLLDQEGAFTARFATFNVIDRDGDVTLPGAFTSGQRVKIAAWGHNWGQLPVGQGTIRADSHAAYVDGHFFTDTAHGRDTYLTVKRLSEAGLQEWSYGFEVLDSEHGRHE